MSFVSGLTGNPITDDVRTTPGAASASLWTQDAAGGAAPATITIGGAATTSVAIGGASTTVSTTGVMAAGRLDADEIRTDAGAVSAALWTQDAVGGAAPTAITVGGAGSVVSTPGISLFSPPHWVGYKNTLQSTAHGVATQINTFVTSESSGGTWGNNDAGAGAAYWVVPRNGLYAMTVDATWQSNTSGYRGMFLASVAVPGAADAVYGRVYMQASTSNTVQFLSTSACFRLTTADFLSLTVHQNSGIALTVPASVNIYDRCDVAIWWVSA